MRGATAAERLLSTRELDEILKSASPPRRNAEQKDGKRVAAL